MSRIFGMVPYFVVANETTPNKFAQVNAKEKVVRGSYLIKFKCP